MKRLFLILGFALTSSPALAELSPEGRFDFYASPWIALHHTAYHLERAARTDLKLRGRVPLHPDDDPEIAQEFMQGCPDIAAAYAPYVATSILFSPDTRRIAKELKYGPDALTDQRVADALKACMPVYKKTLWPIHEASARAFIDRLQSELSRHEAAISEAAAKDIGIEWPDEPVRFDVVPYANWAGAYTDIDPANVTYSSRNARLSGEYALEMVFHEAGHTPPVDTAIMAASIAAMEATGLDNKRFPHYVLFHAMGTAVKEALDGEDYVIYVEATGLAEAADSRDIYDALAAVWDSDASFADRVLMAAERVVAAQSGQKNESGAD